MVKYNPLEEETGLSPVTGAVLMVGITVLLVAVIFTFLGGVSLPDTESSTPSGVEVKSTDSTVTVRVIDAANLDRIQVAAGNTTYNITKPGDAVTVSRANNVVITKFANGEETLLTTVESSPSAPVLSSGGTVNMTIVE